MPVNPTGPGKRADAIQAESQSAKPQKITYELGETYSIPAKNKPKLKQWQGWAVKGPDPERPGNVLAEVFTLWGE